MRIETAKSISIIDLLDSLGYTPKNYRQNGDQVWFFSPFHKETKPSFKVTVSKNTWYDFGIGKGGNILDFLMEKENLDLSGALAYLDNTRLNISNIIKPFQPTPPPQQENIRQIQEFKKLNNKALLHYLGERGINTELICKVSDKSFIKGSPVLGELHYLTNGNKRFAVALKNDNGAYELRSKGFKGCIGAKTITTIEGTDKPSLHIFEGMTDWLSLLTFINWDYLPGTTIILNSISMLELAIDKIKSENYTDVRAYFDNDRAGDQAFYHLQKTISKNILTDKREKYKDFKDLNLFLQAQKK